MESLARRWFTTIENEILNRLKSRQDLWELFTREEEYESSARDSYGRFPYSAARERDIMVPKVSEFLFENGFQPVYPGERKFALCLTHDVDTLDPISHLAMSFASERLPGATRTVSVFAKAFKPFWNFDRIVKLEQEYSARSTFFFMSLDHADPDFSYQAGLLKTSLCFLADNGYEVGLHGSLHIGASLEHLLKQKRSLEGVLEKRIGGYRSHFLRFKVPDTWDTLEKAGFSYDATLGYPDAPGFRNGMCYPFRPYDLVNGRVVNLCEIPLNLMDTSLYMHMGLEIGQMWVLVKSLIDQVRRCNGVLNVLFHNNYLWRKDFWKLYKKTLSYVVSNRGWLSSCGELHEWWSKNGFLK